MRTVLICHGDDDVNRFGIARWLAASSELAGVVILEETAERKRRRIRREIERVGWLRFADVVAFRLYYRLFLASRDREWEKRTLQELERKYPLAAQPEELRTTGPNTPEAVEFIRQARPDILLARCKTLLNERVFTLPVHGTLVMHPGICPEYRNAHGCFWAIANDDRDHVGMTLLKIDKGVDTGPVYGYYSYPFDERTESHVLIQHRVVLENLDALAAKMRDICEAMAIPIDTKGRQSTAWGQPWLSRYLRWKWRDRKRQRGGL